VITIPSLIYLLCAATSSFAALLLARQYRSSRTRFLFWSVAGFAGLAINNVLVFTDLVLVPSVDLTVLRTSIAAAALGALLYGLTDSR
jgi:hypothetical protein